MLLLRDSTAADLDFVLAAESDPDTAPFVICWSREEHERALADADQAHLLVADGARPVGFVLLAGLSNENYSIELRRIVVDRKGQGIGRQAIDLAVDRAFGELGAHRVWLDVKPHNRRARRAYAACGFVTEGTLREAVLTDGAYESLVVMSMLVQEWAARKVSSPRETGL